jgi:Sigma-70 region 2
VVLKAVRGLERDRMLEEIERVYRTGYPTYLRVAAAITDSAELGHDAVQEAFVRATHGRRSFKGRGSLEGWIWRIVVNAARDRHVAADPVVRDVIVEPREEGRGALRDAIARLPEPNTRGSGTRSGSWTRTRTRSGAGPGPGRCSSTRAGTWADCSSATARGAICG